MRTIGQRRGPIIIDNRQRWLFNGLRFWNCPSAIEPTGTDLLDFSVLQNKSAASGITVSTDWQQNGGKTALYLNGSGAYLTTGNSGDSIFSGLKNVTFSCWVNFLSFSKAYNELLENSTGGNQYQFSALVKSNAKLAFYVIAQSTLQYYYDGTGSNTLSTNTWYNLVYVLEANVRQSGYVNGLLDGSASTPATDIASASASLWIGKSTFGDRYPQCYIDDIKIWNRALTAGEIQRLYAGGRGFGLLNSIRRYPMNISTGNRRRRVLLTGEC